MSDIQGIEVALKQVSPARFKKAASYALQKYAVKVDNDAKRLAPVNFGRLRSAIGFDASQIVTSQVVTFFCNVDYAAYMEFGTGPYAAKYVTSLEPEWQSIAQQFKGNGEGRVPAHPFLYPAITKNYPLIAEKLAEFIANDRS
jgi:hypothetical protein